MVLGGRFADQGDPMRGRRIAAALVVAVCWAAAPVGPLPASAAELSLSPASAASGEEVVVRGTGFQLAPPEPCIDAFGKQGPCEVDPEALPIECELTWDGEAVASCDVGKDGTLKGALVVPEQAGPGGHAVRACRPRCGAAGSVEQGESLTVLGGVTPTPSAGATAPVTPSPGPTAEQTPTPTRTPTASPEPTTAPPPVTDEVDVPLVLRLDLAGARRLLQADGLRVGEVRGTGRVVEQRPVAGTSAPVGSPVDLVLRPDDPLAVVVPDLTGRTVAEAQELLGPSLALDDPPSGDGVIERQTPAARTSVAPGTLVRVALAAPASSTLRRLVPLLIAVLVLLAGAAASGVRARRRSRRRAASPPAARLQAVPDLRPLVRTTTTVPAQRLPVLELLVRPDDHPVLTTEVRA